MSENTKILKRFTTFVIDSEKENDEVIAQPQK